MSDLIVPTPNGVDEQQKVAKTVSYYAAFIALGLVNAILGPTLPGLAENTRTQLSEISYLFIARSLGYLLGSLLGGRLYDRLPGHTVMAVMVLGMVATLVLVPFIPLLSILIAILLLMGIAEGALDVGGNTLLVWVHRHKVGPFMNGLHFFFGIGAFLAPIIVAQALLYSGGMSWAYWFVALLILPIIFPLLRLASPVVHTIAKDDPTRQTNPGLVALMAFFLMLYVGAEVSFGGWIYTYTVTLGIAEEATAAYLTSAFWGALTVGRLLAIPIAARFRPRFILLSDLLGALASAGLILLWSNSLAIIWIGTLGMGLFLASVFPTTLSLAERRMTITGQVTSFFFVGASLGAMTVPWLVGQLFEAIGPHMVMIAVLIDLIIAVAIFAVMMAYSAVKTEKRLVEEGVS